MAEQKQKVQKITNISNLLKIICINDIFLVYIAKNDGGKYSLKYYPKSKTAAFYTGIDTETLGEARKKLTHILKLIKKAQNKKNKDEFLVIIDNDVKLLSEVEFAEDSELIIGD